MRSIIEAIASRRPELVQAFINALQALNDSGEVKDLQLWVAGCANPAYCIIFRRCGGDVEWVEEALLDSLEGKQ